MLNRQKLSISSSKKCSPAPAPAPALATAGVKINEQRKKKQSPRNPLQLLNNTGISRNNSTNSNISCSSSMSVDAPSGCLRFFLLSNPSSSSSSSKTKTKTPLLYRSKSHSNKSKPTAPKSAPNTTRPSNPSSSSRSSPSFKENHLPKQPTSLKPRKKKNPPCLYQWQSCKKQGSRNAPKGPKPKPSRDLGSPVYDLASGSKEFGQILKDLKQQQQQQQQCAVRMVDDAGELAELLKLSDPTTVGKLAACGPVLDCAIDDKTVEENSITSATTTKTPPVQASVSPEIQCGSSTLVSAATPTCYGAGHVVSGVADRRKCRPRGILTVGLGGGIDSSGCSKKANVFDNDSNDDFDIGVLRNCRNSLIPLPAEASMSWLLSPCQEHHDDQKGENLVGSATLYLASSASYCQSFSSDSCKNASYSGANNTDATTSSEKTRITLLSPGRLPEFQGALGPSSDKVAGCSTSPSASPSPHSTPSCKAVLTQEERKYRYNLTGESSPFSIESLSSGNVIQTPNSDSSSDRHVSLSCFNAPRRQKHHFESKLDSAAEVLGRAALSPKGHESLWDPLGLSFQFTDLTSTFDSIHLSQLQKILDNCASSISNSTLECVSQSQMRISWREGLVGRIFEMDEFDCCRWLSDEENDADGCSNGQFKSDLSQEFNVNVQDDWFLIKGLRSPDFLERELIVDGKGKMQLSPQGRNSCAESICTDGGGLVASGDSDWTFCYKNRLFEV